MLKGPVFAAITSKGEYDIGSFALACAEESLVKERMCFSPDEFELWKAGTMSSAAQGRAMAHSWLRSDYDTFDIIASDAIGEGREVPYRVTEYGTVVGDWSICFQFMMYLTCGEIVTNMVDRAIEFSEQIEAATDGKENPADDLWNELRSGLMPGTSTVH